MPDPDRPPDSGSRGETPSGEANAAGAPVDFTIRIGEQRFDPHVAPLRRRRRRPSSAGGAAAPAAASSAGPARPDREVAGRAERAGGRRRQARGARPAGSGAGPEAEGGPGPAPSDPADSRIVQFVGPLSASDIRRLRDAYGLALTAYVPNFAYVEAVPRAVQRRLRADPLVRAIVPYLPEFKVASRVAGPAPARPEGVPEGRQRLYASLFSGGSPERVRHVLEQLGADDVGVADDRAIGGAARVRFTLPEGASLDAVAELDDVRWIDLITPDKDDNVGAASMIQSGDAGTAPIWDKGIHGEGQVIGMLDGSPLDIAHCFFDDVAPNSAGPTHRKVLAIRNASGTAPQAHATFVAGCAAGDERGNPGGNSARGGAWAAKLVSGNRRDISLAGNSLLQELTSAMASGAFVHTNSWHRDTAGAGNPAVYTDVAQDVDTFTWTNEDHLVLGSSGNTGEEQGPPGTAKNALCVAAAGTGANAMNLGDGSPGPTADGRRKPDLVAVGCGITSATVATPCGVAPDVCAASWATPHAAAAAALVRQYLTEGWYPTGEKVAANAMVPTGALLRAILTNATVDMTGVAGYPNQTEGWGLLRLDRALFFPGSRRRPTLWDVRHATGPTDGETRTHTLEVVEDTEQLKVTLAFSDPPPPDGSFAAPVVNNLDLVVSSPDGTAFVGNAFTDGVSTPDVTADAGDPINTIETVLVNRPRAGRWTIEVRAVRVAVGNPGQGYGLVATAATKSCFVAGTVYGDPGHPEVEALRAWRDRHVAPGAPGRRLVAAGVRLYDRLGPRAAARVAPHPRLRALLRRRVLGPLARRLSREHGAGGR